ncbi:MAG: FAD-binding oxidoreductase [Acidobacteriota bacterium]|nr:FAD-binding oxidoreductase [Acidobacteriota bacterium]
MALAERWDILVVGSGIAGLSTAHHLSRQTRQRILLVDREVLPGFYASGHSAGIARQLTGRREHSRLAVEGRNRLAEAGLLTGTGGLLLAREATALDAVETEAEELGVAVKRKAGAGIEGCRAEAHLSVPSDGVIDVHGLLGLCARSARESGVELRYGCEVRDIERAQEGFRVDTSAGSLVVGTIINAAGAWAGDLGRKAGGLGIAFRPLRRHLAWSDQPYDGHQPYAWWVDCPLYLKPESGGLLMCPCDEDEVALPPSGLQPGTNAEVFEQLADSIHQLAPSLVNHGINRAWSGLRTFAPDRRFVLGWDPVNPDLFWVAGLGGHGMTTGLAVGKLAAELYLQRGEHELSPLRLMSQ